MLIIVHLKQKLTVYPRELVSIAVMEYVAASRTTFVWLANGVAQPTSIKEHVYNKQNALSVCVNIC